MKKLLFVICFLLFVENAHAFSTNARSAYLIDYDSGAEIFAKNADVLMPPSSMIKLMTLTVLFDEIKSGNIKMDDIMSVGQNADYKNPTWYPASKICLSSGQKLNVSDAIYGLIVQSAGDATVVVAEHISGSESAFAKRMTDTARRLGMRESTFGNASGLPDPNNLMTSRELGILATHLISDYPDLYPRFATKRFEFSDYKSDWCREWGRTHTLNYNKLLFIMPGADGMKTGHTDDGGYGMVASARVGGRRLVGVINGLRVKTHNALAEEMKKLLNYGYNNTTNKHFYSAGDTVAEIPVWYGRQKTVVGTVARDFAVTLNSDQSLRNLRIVARYDEPVRAPIATGDKIGEILAYYRGDIIARTPLVAKFRVNKTIFFGRIWQNVKVIFGGR